jgi:hypothetical protein
MTVDERLKYLRVMKAQYVGGDRAGKTQLLSEMQRATGYERKHLIRLLNGDLKRKRRKGGRGRKYGAKVDDALRVIYEAWDCICAERLAPNLVWMAEHLAGHGEIAVDKELLGQLGEISESSVERRLRRLRQDERRLPRRRPRREKAILRGIPMGRLAWDTAVPGYMEADLVHHCGNSSRDVYMCTLQLIDVKTGWSERRAILGRGQTVMEDAFETILGRMPFRVHVIHPDNDSAFFNHHLLRFWGERVPGVKLSRSRPYHKNDNPRVEQKNRTLVRDYLGDGRLDTVAHVLATNHLYDLMWVYYNLFQPVMHLVEKKVIQNEGRPPSVVRRHDKARTPFDRLCETDAILPVHRGQLEAVRARTNPRRLRREIWEAVHAIAALPGAVSGHPENAYDTLAHSLVFENHADDPLYFGFDRTPISRRAH